MPTGLPPRHHPPVAQRFGHMHAAHVRLALQIRQRPRHAQHPVIPAGTEFQPFRRVGEQFAAVGVGGGDVFQQGAVGFGVVAQSS